MDANNTRFHLLLGKDDWLWAADAARSLDWDEAGQSLILHRQLFRFPTPPGDVPPRLGDRRGAGRDRYGNWYWIDESGTEIRFAANGRDESEHFWSSADLDQPCPPGDGSFGPLVAPSAPAVYRLRGLAVTTHHYLVVGVLSPAAGLLIFDLHGGGAPVEMRWPAPFSPFDIAPMPGGGAAVLDRDAKVYWLLDRHFRVEGLPRPGQPPVEDDFQPAAAQPGDPPRQRKPETFPMPFPLEPGGFRLNLIAIEGLPDGSVLVLEGSEADSRLMRYRCERGLWQESLRGKLDAYLAESERGKPLIGSDFAFVPAAAPAAPGRIEGTLFIAAADGNQAFGFRVTGDDETLNVEALPGYYPMRLFGGRALVGSDEGAYYDSRERWVPLVEQPRPRFVTSGQLESPVFDGDVPDCVWHRLFIDGCIPPGTEVIVESRAANTPDLLAHMAWAREPHLYRRASGPELPNYRPFAGSAESAEGTGTWELLFQRATGRYAQVRLTLQGTGRHTPRLYALRAYYPRFSYLDEYLPAVYRQDEPSAWFMERYLANLEGMFTALEDRIASAQTYFDVRTVRAEYLEWLAGWLGAIIDSAWDEARQRLFIKHAVELFAQRGTPAGLIRAVRLAIEPCPDDSLFERDVLQPDERESKIVRYTVRVIERFMTRRAPGVAYGDPTDVAGPGLIDPTFEWQPAQGAEPLHRRFRDFAHERYGTLEAINAAWQTAYSALSKILLPPTLPANAALATDWREFLRKRLGFSYAEVSANDGNDTASYRAFLSSVYRTIGALNDAYASGYDRFESFESIALPTTFPASGRPLFDWIQFVSLWLPIQRSAHRFTVLIPTDPQATQAAQDRLIGVVQRIVQAERPAHTAFDIKQYWALFRVGEARLGLDTLIDQGSRFVALILGKGFVGSSYLTAAYPWNVTDRVISDRDRLGADLTL